MKNLAEKQRILYLTFFFIILCGLGFYGYWQAAPRPKNQQAPFSRIEITPSRWDFGEVEYGRVLHYTFKVRNSGKEILQIKKVATSCACTQAKISQTEIGPGGQTDLLVTYDTGAMSGAHGKGEQERIIWVQSNDPERLQAEVVIQATVN